MAINLPPGPLEFLKMLAHDVRWKMLQALAMSDLQVNELVSITAEPMNLVSYHLKLLRGAGLVSTRRSEVDAREVYYSLDHAHMYAGYQQAGKALHLSPPPSTESPATNGYRVLFVCTHNSARSQMAEALLRHLSDGRVITVSAGSHPSQIHPDTIRTMESLGLDLRGHYAKSFEDIASQTFDVVITVCDRAREICPVFPGRGHRLHWGYPDPVAETDLERRAALFNLIAAQLRIRIQHFLTTLSAEADQHSA